MWVPVVVVVVVVEGSRQCAFWVVEIFLSTPNKICLLRTKFVYSEQNLCTLVKIFGIRTFGICAFFVVVLHYCCMCTLSFLAKKFFVVVPLHYCCCAYTRLGRTDRRTDRRTDVISCVGPSSSST